MECPPEIQRACPLRKHRMNRHHLYYPAYDYSTPLEKAFRNLAENVVLTCTYEHNMIHLEEPTPIKPNRDEMIRAVNRPDL